MSSVQERLQLKRTAVDKWTIREHLCLASAVSCSGDQNWMSVSRTLKILCGINRPADWFSQKSCAVQFNEILENVETPKRKKRTVSERDNQNQPAETPTESIHRKLTQERITEIKIHLQQEQQEYATLREEYMNIQNGSINDDEIREMWSKIERDKEQTILEQQKYALWLKEREERKLELQRAWRPVGTPSTPTTSASANITPQQSPNVLVPLKPLTIMKSDDMDIDETISPVAKQQQQQQLQQQQQPPGTSPLLTSLLKSQSSGNSGQIQAPVTSTTARIIAPTITNLLTGGGITTAIKTPQTTAPHIVTNQSQQQFNHVHQTKPLTGLPLQIIPQQPQVVVQSPSQEAPTLSLLLETKTITPVEETSTTSSNLKEIKKEILKEEETMEIEEEEENAMQIAANKEMIDVFDNLIEENINELAEMLTSNSNLLPELLDQDLENVDLDEDDSQDESFLDIDKDLLDEVNEELVLDNKEEIENTTKNVAEVSIVVTEVKDEKTVKCVEIEEDNKVTANVVEAVATDEKNTKIPEDEIQDEKLNILPENELSPKSKSNETTEQILTETTKKVEQLVEEKVEIVKEPTPEIQIQDENIKKNVPLVVGDKLQNEEIDVKMPEEDDDKNTEISEDSVDVSFLEITNEINEKIKAEVGQESKESAEDIMEIITGNIQSIQSTESDGKKSILNHDEDTRDAIQPEEETIKSSSVSDKHSNDLQSKEKSSSESSDVIMITEEVKNPSENQTKDSPLDENIKNAKDAVQEKEAILETIPKEEVQQPKVEVQQPKVEVQQPKVEVQQPKVEVQQPKVEEKTTKTNDVKPKLPSIGLSQTLQILPEKRKSIIEAATAITIIDTDEDTTHIEPIKDEKPAFFQSSIATSRLSLSRRDYSRKKSDPDTVPTPTPIPTLTVIKKKSEEPEESKQQNLSVKKLRENREGSESPLVDYEMNESPSLPKTRRRCSSTPVIDSIPNSPASATDIVDHKAWKKSILIAYNRLVTHKNAAIFLRQFSEDQAPKFKQMCLRPMDLQTIKRNIENGVIRTTTDFQRDVMLVCQNAMMYYKKNSTNYNVAKDIMSEIVAISEHITEKDIKKEKDETIITPKILTPIVVIASTGNPPIGVTTPNTIQQPTNPNILQSAVKSRTTGSRKSLRLP